MSKRVFISGVSRGLGRGLAKFYLRAGWSVFGCARSESESLVREGLRFRAVDLAVGEAGAAAVSELLNGVEDLDLVILNAAKLGEIRDLGECPLEDLRETMEINVWANKWLLEAIFAGVGGRNGRAVKQVVAISSGASINGSRGWNGYSISKAALNMLIKVVAPEYPETHFCSLAPGLIDTAMQDYLTNLPVDKRFAPLETLRAAKGTDQMPDEDEAAGRIAQAFPKLLELDSGGYADVRKL